MPERAVGVAINRKDRLVLQPKGRPPAGSPQGDGNSAPMASAKAYSRDGPTAVSVVAVKDRGQYFKRRLSQVLLNNVLFYQK